MENTVQRMSCKEKQTPTTKKFPFYVGGYCQVEPDSQCPDTDDYNKEMGRQDREEKQWAENQPGNIFTKFCLHAQKWWREEK